MDFHLLPYCWGNFSKTCLNGQNLCPLTLNISMSYVSVMIAERGALVYHKLPGFWAAMRPFCAGLLSYTLFFNLWEIFILREQQHSEHTFSSLLLKCSSNLQLTWSRLRSSCEINLIMHVVVALRKMPQRIHAEFWPSFKLKRGSSYKLENWFLMQQCWIQWKENQATMHICRTSCVMHTINPFIFV